MEGSESKFSKTRELIEKEQLKESLKEAEEPCSEVTLQNDSPIESNRRKSTTEESISEKLENLDIQLAEDMDHFEELDEEIDELKAQYIKATVKYYREIIRKEDLLILKKILSKNNELNPEEKAVFKKLNFQNLKLYHVWNIEKNLLKCIEYEDIPKDDRIAVMESSREILVDFHINKEDYKKMFVGLASRGISAYHLFQSLIIYFEKQKFQFDKESLMILGKIIKKKFEEHVQIEYQVKIYELCRKEMKSFFTKEDGKINILSIDIMKKKLQKNKTKLDDHIKEFRDYFNTLRILRENIENNYKFLLYFYDLKDHWHQKCVEKLKTQENTSNLFLFKDIDKNFIELKEYIKEKGIGYYGPSQCRYHQVSEILYVLAKYLHTAYFIAYNTSKANEMQLHSRKLENYLGIMQWTSI